MLRIVKYSGRHREQYVDRQRLPYIVV